MIFFDRVMDHPNSTSILIDNYQAAYKATEHLIQQGCKRIAHITTVPRQNVYRDRLKGYRDALANHKLKYDEQQVIVTTLGQEAGAAAAQAILSMKPRPDGIFVANDTTAIGCMIALKAKGISIPADIAVVGFNNDPASTVVEPNLTTVNYSGFEIGQVAARNLISHLDGTSTIDMTNTIIFRSELIVRQSSLRKH